MTSSVATLTVIDTNLDFQASWVRQYNGTDNHDDFAQAVVIDGQGNVCLAGYAKESASGNRDYVTLKYDRNGNLLWRAVYDGGSGDDEVAALKTDSDGNLYVTGASKGPGSGWDYVTVKYGPNGNQLWVARYNGVVNKDDLARSLALGDNGVVVVTGASKGAGDRFNYVTIQYDRNGNQQWLARYIAPRNDDDQASAVAVDRLGNVYVTGKSKGDGTDFDFATLKYDGNGIQQWLARFNGTDNRADVPVKVLVNDGGEVIVTGAAVNAGGDQDYATLNYSSNGTQLWLAIYDGPQAKDDLPRDMAFDSAGNLIVSGNSAVTDTKADFATVKYSSQGQQLWVNRVVEVDDEQAAALTLDRSGDVYIAGSSKRAGTGYDLALVKIRGTDGVLLASETLNSSGGVNDVAVGVAVDADYTVYLAGQGFASWDYILIQYQPNYLQPVARDLAVSNIALNSATLTATVDSKGAQTTCFFLYGTTTAYGAASAVFTLPPGVSSISAPLSSLSAGTWHHFCLVASNAAGVTVTPDATFATSVGAPSGSTLSASDVTETSAVLHGSVNQQIVALTSYFQYGETTNYGFVTPGTLVPAILGILNSGSLLQVATPISGLAPGTIYHYRLVVTGLGGTTYGPDACFVTPSAPPVRISPGCAAQVGGGGHMQMGFSATPGATFTVMSSTNMLDWAVVGTMVETSSGNYTFVDSNPATNSSCFYRVRSP